MPQVLENSAHLSRDELIERTEAGLSAYARERRRNGELVHRLQQMHGEQVDMLELKKRCVFGRGPHGRGCTGCSSTCQGVLG